MFVATDGEILFYIKGLKVFYNIEVPKTPEVQLL